MTLDELANELDNLNDPVDMNQLFQEVVNSPQAIALLHLYYQNVVDFQGGGYASLNLGAGGETYNRIREFLETEVGKNNLPILFRYLNDGLSLEPYEGAGPGGQGNSKDSLTKVTIGIKSRIDRVVGMMLAYDILN